MITKEKKPYFEEDGTPKGELRIGWASWDDNTHTQESIKWAYKNTAGKISRGAPELPFHTLVQMMLFALEENKISNEDIDLIRDALNR